jgi:hypothetical protein
LRRPVLKQYIMISPRWILPRGHRQLYKPSNAGKVAFTTYVDCMIRWLRKSMGGYTSYVIVQIRVGIVARLAWPLLEVGFRTDAALLSHHIQLLARGSPVRAGENHHVAPANTMLDEPLMAFRISLTGPKSTACSRKSCSPSAPSRPMGTAGLPRSRTACRSSSRRRTGRYASARSRAMSLPFSARCLRARGRSTSELPG